jgi:phosphatidylglycerophosphate synthase
MFRFPRPEDFFTVNRRIASAVAPYLARTPLAPNHVTLLAMACGCLSAVFFSRGTRAGMLQGAFFLQVSFILDDCDGAIARLKSLQSEFGMWLDYAADVCVELALWTGLALGAAAQRVSVPLAAAIAALAALGSLVNFLRVVGQRRRKMRVEAPKAIAALCDDGDPSPFVWLISAVGHPGYLLLFGALYMHCLWVFSVIKARKKEEPCESSC